MNKLLIDFPNRRILGVATVREIRTKGLIGASVGD